MLDDAEECQLRGPIGELAPYTLLSTSNQPIRSDIALRAKADHCQVDTPKSESGRALKSTWAIWLDTAFSPGLVTDGRPGSRH
jgi:hypothetical protein